MLNAKIAYIRNGYIGNTCKFMNPVEFFFQLFRALNYPERSDRDKEEEK